ncbi:MAG TPA: TolC family protein [Candidatus Acidoferrales bacterium]|nr:TolC family protein [Candidatus Acidoferrales bacterium]
MRTRLYLPVAIAILGCISAQAQVRPPQSIPPPQPPPSQQSVPESSQAANALAAHVAGPPLTLKEAEDLALKRNPQISIGKLQALVSQQNVREFRSALMPNAYLSVTAADSHAGSRITAGALNNPIIFPRVASGVTVSQLITDFGRTNKLLASSEYQAKAEDMLAQATSAQIILAVDQAFFNALETKALVTVAQETVNTRQTFVDKIQALTGAKLKSDIDLSFANVDLARGRLLLLEAVNNYEAALNSLSAILGYQDQQNLEPVEEIKETAPPAPDVNPLVMQALQQRPEVQALTDQVAAAEKFASAEHDLKKPTISALAAAGVTPVRSGQPLTNWYGAAGVNINLPLFNGFLFDARAKAADFQTEANRQRLSDERNNIARDVRNAWQDTNRAYERLSVTRQLREQANLAFDLAQSRYNLGLSSIVEFSQAVLQKTEADIEGTDAQYQYRLTQIVLAFTMSGPK